MTRAPRQRPDESSAHAEAVQRNAGDAAAWLQHARRGEFEQAWSCSDRILARGRINDHTIPRHQQQIWDGTPLDGRRVLVRCYHGLGDTLQFIRYAPRVRAVAREVIVWAQPALLDLLESARGIDALLPLHEGTPEVDHDVDVELMELPYVFRSTLATIPRDVPYLSAAPLTVPGPSPRIGLVWRAGGWDTSRSIPFAAIARLLDLGGCSWCRLQHGALPAEQHPRLHALDTEGVARTARCMRALDLVVTIDSLSAHLAGALGVPVWTLLPAPADWRWLEDRDDSPWYPTMRLFRQPTPGDWAAVIEEVRQALCATFGLPRG